MEHSPEVSKGGRINFSKGSRDGEGERALGRQQLGVSHQLSPGRQEGSGKWQETKDSLKVREKR